MALKQEIELKLELTSEAAAAFEQLTLLPEQSETAELHAVYFDTPDRRLQAAGYTLRIRTSGAKHVQTVKADPGGQGAAVFARAEWEMPVAGKEPVIDGRTPVAAILGDAAEMVEPVFKVEVERRTWVVSEGTANIELVLDRGWVRAGARQAPICEIELELKTGDIAALFSVARRIEATVPVRIGVAAKSERGYRLLALARASFKAEPVALTPAFGAQAAFEMIVQACMRQYRLNEDVLLDQYEPQALHQARVAVRRLRSGLTLFKAMLAEADVIRFQDELRWLAGLMGEARDLDVLIERMKPGELLEQISDARAVAHGRVIEVLQSRRVRVLMIDIAEWLATGAGHVTADQEAVREEPAAIFAARRLKHFHRWLKKHGRHVAKLDDERRHEVRKKAKKLRYAAEFFEGLFDSEKQRRRHGRYVAALEDLQDELGALNDLASAGDILARHGLPVDVELVERGGRKKKLLAAAGKAQNELANKKRFWR